MRMHWLKIPSPQQLPWCDSERVISAATQALFAKSLLVLHLTSDSSFVRGSYFSWSWTVEGSGAILRDVNTSVPKPSELLYHSETTFDPMCFLTLFILLLKEKRLCNLSSNCSASVFFHFKFFCLFGFILVCNTRFQLATVFFLLNWIPCFTQKTHYTSSLQCWKTLMKIKFLCVSDAMFYFRQCFTSLLITGWFSLCMCVS